MALTVTQAQPNQTISGVTQAQGGTISGVTQANPGTISGVSQTPIAGATNLNPQGTTSPTVQGSTTNPQPASTTPIQGTSPNLQPTTAPNTGTFKLGDGSVYDINGKLISGPTAPAPTPTISPTQQAFNQTKASGTPPPQTAGEAAPTIKTATDQAASGPAPDISKQISFVTQTLANDPGYQKLLADQKQYTDTVAQSESLTKQYQDLLTQYNVPGINSELLNMKKIIDGTQDDIRHEVTASGGFATESQVLGLATARNKTLIQNYNTLVAQKADLMSQINTISGLEAKDKELAQQVALNQLQIDQQINSYTEKFQANAKEGYNNVINAVGYAGLYKALSASGDPNAIKLAEQTLGLGPGSLQVLGTQVDSAKALDLALKQTQLQQANLNLQQSQAEEPLKVQQLQAQIAQEKASAASSGTSAAKNAYDLQFEKQYGVTPDQFATVQQQQADSIQKQQDAINAKAGSLTAELANHKTTWGAAWNELHTAYPDLTTQKVDDLLMANLYRNPQYGG